MFDHTQALLTTSNKNLFNGKELQHNEFGYNNGLEVYDFGARLYEPQIGRWSAADPLAAAAPNWSPYRAFYDNPTYWTDPTGLWETDAKGNTSTTEADEIKRFTEMVGAETNLTTESALNFANAEEKESGSGRLSNGGMFFVSVDITREKNGSFSPDYFSVQNLENNIQDHFDELERVAVQEEMESHMVTGTPDFGIGGGVKGIIGVFKSIRSLWKGATVVAKEGEELFNFSTKAAEHMANPGRAVPVQILEQAIKGSKGLADPRGSQALMHTTEMFKNGKAYNLEVLYDKASNSIWHFMYSPK